MSKRQEKELQQIQDSQKASRYRRLGWEEVDGWQHEQFRWRCAKCKELKLYIDCGRCNRCEACYVCE